MKYDISIYSILKIDKNQNRSRYGFGSMNIFIPFVGIYNEHFTLFDIKRKTYFGFDSKRVFYCLFCHWILLQPFGPFDKYFALF